MYKYEKFIAKQIHMSNQDTSLGFSITKSPNRVKLILVDEIPLKYLNICVQDPNSIFTEYDQDVVRGLTERCLIYKISDQSIVYTNPSLKEEFIFFKDATKINSSQLLLTLVKFPNSQIILFLTKENEESSKLDPNLSVVDTNLDELNVESWREKTHEESKNISENVEIRKRKANGERKTISENKIILDAKSIVDKFKNEMNRVLFE